MAYSAGNGGMKPSKRALSKAEKRSPTPGVLSSEGPRYFWLYVVWPRARAVGFVGKIGERCQVEELVDEFDDRAMLGGFMGDGVNHAIGRDHDRGNAGTLIEGVSHGIPGADHRLSVIVEAVAFIVGDDNGALRPILAAGDGVDRVSQQGLADLRVGVARMVVVAGESALDRRARRPGNELIEVAVPAANVEYSTFFRQRVRADRRIEVAETLQVVLRFYRVVGLIAEILRAVVMGDVAGISWCAGRIGRLVIISFLEPTPIYRLVLIPGDLLDVVLNIQEIKGGVQIRSRDRLNLVSHKRERQTCKGKI